MPKFSATTDQSEGERGEAVVEEVEDRPDRVEPLHPRHLHQVIHQAAWVVVVVVMVVVVVVVLLLLVVAWWCWGLPRLTDTVEEGHADDGEEGHVDESEVDLLVNKVDDVAGREGGGLWKKLPRFVLPGCGAGEEDTEEEEGGADGGGDEGLPGPQPGQGVDQEGGDGLDQTHRAGQGAGLGVGVVQASN